MLLGSPPDMIHGSPLRRTDLSSLLTWVRQYSKVPGAGIHPCCSGLQVQGTAISPTSAALLHAGPKWTSGKSRYVIFYYKFAKLSIPHF